MRYIRGEVASGIDARNIGDPRYVAAAYQNGPLSMRYLSRALVEGSPAAARMFDEMVDITEALLKEHSNQKDADFRGQAAGFVAMKLGVMVLGDHVSRALGADLFDPKASARVGRAGLDIIDPEFVGRDIADLARSGLDRYERGDKS